jgi:hypothetical protein
MNHPLLHKLTRAPLGIVVTAISLHSSAILAHGGEDHSQDAKPAVTAVANPGNASHATPDAPQRLSDGSLFVPKSVQRQLGIRTHPVAVGELSATLELNGKVIPNPDAGGRIQATQAGSVLPGPKGMPAPGRKVVKGEVLAYLRPAGGAIERGNQLAQVAELGGQLSIADARVKRFEQLEGAVPQKEIDSARIERDALKQRHAAVSASVNSPEVLVAPVTGVISEAHVVAGQVVDARDILFEIIDPARLSVEALAYDPGLVPTITGASALADDYATLELKLVGGGRQLREQALPLLFQITKSSAPVPVGQPVKVIVRTAKGVQGAAVARTAVTKVGSGETAVWVHTEAERFVARRVKPVSLDAGNVAIIDALHAGERVVVDGAGLLSQIR